MRFLEVMRNLVRQMQEFRDVLDECRFHDPGFEGESLHDVMVNLMVLLYGNGWIERSLQ